jgi:hypothetical protein
MDKELIAEVVRRLGQCAHKEPSYAPAGAPTPASALFFNFFMLHRTLTPAQMARGRQDAAR